MQSARAQKQVFSAWEPFGGLLGASWGLLGTSRGGELEMSVRVPPVGPFLGPSWGPLGPSWRARAVLGPSWGRLGLSWGPPVALSGLSWERWGPPGSVLGRPGAPWGRLGALLGRLGALLGASGAVLGRSWRLIRPSWTLCRPKTRVWQKCTFSERNGAIFASWGSFRKPQGAAWERLGPSWSRLRGVPRRSGAVLDRPLRDRGRSEGSAAAPRAARGGPKRPRARSERPRGGRFAATAALSAQSERCTVV